MEKLKLIFAFLLSCVLCMGCSSNKYDMVFYDFAGEWINADYIAENLVYPIGDRTNPDTRTVIVDSVEKYKEVFVEDIEELEIDFDEQIIIIYTFIATNCRDNYITSVKQEEDNLKIGDEILSSRKISEITGFSNSIINSAINSLASMGILTKKGRVFVIANNKFDIEKIKIKTLVEKVADEIKDYINQELSDGDKLPPNSVLVKKFKVSSKTIHDAIKLLSKQGLLYTRRGQYGTIVLGENNQTELYDYEKFEQKIKQYISSNCQTGDKLPAVKELAKIYKTSEKTVKKALNNLAEDGYLAFSRGRYGGTFILDLPQNANEAYKWLAISTDYFDGMN